MTRPLATLAALGALLVPTGIAMMYPPAGVIALGVVLLCCVYVVAYLKTKGGRT